MKQILICANLLIFLFIGIFSYTTTTKQDQTVATISSNNLRTKVETYILENEAKPHEPRLDPVWYFVPGLYGIAFDLEMSYQNMLINGQFDPALMVSQQVPYTGSSETFRQHRLYRGNENSPYIGLLINVAWGGEALTQMLDILDTHHVKAAIFFEGKYADANPNLVLDAFERGHLIGNHSYSHPADWQTLTYDGFSAEISQTNQILSKIIDQEITFFAPPGGAFTEATISAAYNQGMYTILWSADTIDWRGEPSTILIERVLNRISPGGLILTHPKPETVIALPTIIKQLRQTGYEFARIDEIISGERQSHLEN